MKIRYTPDGSINVVCIDSESLSGNTILSVQDNQDLLINPAKYSVVNSEVAIRPSLELTATPSSAKADNTETITINIQAKQSNGENDSSAAYIVTLRALPRIPISSVTLSAQSINLVEGVGNVTIKASTPTDVVICARTGSAYGGTPAQVIFTP